MRFVSHWFKSATPLLTALTLALAVQAVVGMLLAFADQFEPLPMCHLLLCNDPSDCGSKCFCNNPTDTLGSCFADR